MNSIRLSSSDSQESWEIPVILDDADLLVLDKPARLLTSPDRNDPDSPNLMHLLHQGIKQNAAWARERGLEYLSQAYRLDSETSGILILAKTKPALIHLVNQFSSGSPIRRFAVLVHGCPPAAEFEVNRRIANDTRRLGRMRTDPHRGKAARTRFRVRECYSRFTLLEGYPMTDRTHQVRVHLRSLRLPIVGDSLYGGRPLLLSRLKKGYRFKADRPEIPLLGRAALHAEALTIMHPSQGIPVTMEAPWPKDFTVATKYLARYGLPQSSASPVATPPPAPSSLRFSPA